MHTLILCLFIACLLPYLSKIPVALAMKEQPGGYDNSDPRGQQAALTGFGARAVAAHQNSFESLIIYAAAVLTALATQHITPVIEWLALSYLVIRVVYHVLYLLDWATLRSTVWALSLFASLSILWLCLPLN
jgi:uncharacterized MAPEG superfamily protein